MSDETEHHSLWCINLESCFSCQSILSFIVSSDSAIFLVQCKVDILMALNWISNQWSTLAECEYHELIHSSESTAIMHFELIQNFCLPDSMVWKPLSTLHDEVAHAHLHSTTKACACGQHLGLQEFQHMVESYGCWTVSLFR